MINIGSYIALATTLFSIGLIIVLFKKNIIVVLIGIELMLNASNIIFVGASQYHGNGLDGHIFTLFTIVIAVAEAAVILAIILRMVRAFRTTDISKIKSEID